MNSLLLIVASNLAIASCIAVIAIGAGRWSKSPALAHLIWMAVFIKLITPPLVLAPVTIPSTWGSHFESVYSALATAPQAPTGNGIAVQADAASTKAIALRSLSSPPNRVLMVLREITCTRCLVAIWLLGTSVICLRGMWRFNQFSRLLVREGTIDDEATAVVARLIWGRCRFVPKVRRIAARVSPMLFGVGRMTCIVCPNHWASENASAQLLMLEGSSLTTAQRLDIPHNIALAQQHAKKGWLAVDWSGTLWSLETGMSIGSLPKESVSGVTLCQDVFDRIEFLALHPTSATEPYFSFRPPTAIPAPEQLR